MNHTRTPMAPASSARSPTCVTRELRSSPGQRRFRASAIDVPYRPTLRTSRRADGASRSRNGSHATVLADPLHRAHVGARSSNPTVGDRRLVLLLGVLEEVLAEHRQLPLVVGADVLAVEHVGLLRHALEGELADGLAMLDHERHVPRPDLERGAAAGAGAALARVAEAWVEEAGVVGAQLAGGGVVG